MKKPSALVKAVYREHIARFGEPAQSIRYEDAPVGSSTAVPAFVDVMVWPADEELDITSFATIGMSDQEMARPGGRAELHFSLEGNVDPQTMGRITLFLANLSLYPFINHSHLDWWHVIPEAGHIPHFADMRSVLIHPAFVDDGWSHICHEAQCVKILNVVPITRPELEVYRASGIACLRQYFEQREINLFAPR
ncbi:suppressor of fused domain protein [Comamonas resistens]|uniref:Suppressor of fused domain protein n=1 Tax=Comamonas resistens TaxID=3046670 RepID=A0ABY8SV94_9BURK|nr:suppressor of fused domain protein [Comamonas resistens]MDL5038067.1 suppressor of fused domain protein [Comamonas resistens]WHS66908.1 suppressor of fused domain protein [Comamonas resistens]